MNVILCLVWMIFSFVLVVQDAEINLVISSFMVTGIFSISVAISNLTRAIKEIKGFKVTTKEIRHVDKTQ